MIGIRWTLRGNSVRDQEYRVSLIGLGVDISRFEDDRRSIIGFRGDMLDLGWLVALDIALGPVLDSPGVDDESGGTRTAGHHTLCIIQRHFPSIELSHHDIFVF